MRLKNLVVSFGVGSMLLASSSFFTSCTPKVTEEQLTQLQDLRRRERTLNDDISRTRTSLTKIESEIASRRNEVTNCNKQKDFINQKLSSWPNSWPDWSPDTAAVQTPGR
ncbi:MAG: hypothetical protein ACM3U1_09950 [Chloroflexota bacterium]